MYSPLRTFGRRNGADIRRGRREWRLEHPLTGPLGVLWSPHKLKTRKHRKFLFMLYRQTAASTELKNLLNMI